MFITPEYLFSGAAAITPEFLKGKGITALVLDVDNTLTGHDSQQLPPAIRDWLDRMRAAGIQLAIASNNNEERVRPFAQAIGLDYVAMSCKPLTFGLARARKKFGHCGRPAVHRPAGRCAVWHSGAGGAAHV